MEEAKTLYPYTASDTKELSFDAGVTVTILKKREDGWFKIKLPSGEKGLAPANYLQVMAKAEKKKKGKDKDKEKKSKKPDSPKPKKLESPKPRKKDKGASKAEKSKTVKERKAPKSPTKAPKGSKTPKNKKTLKDVKGKQPKSPKNKKKTMQGSDYDRANTKITKTSKASKANTPPPKEKKGKKEKVKKDKSTVGGDGAPPPPRAAPGNVEKIVLGPQIFPIEEESSVTVEMVVNGELVTKIKGMVDFRRLHAAAETVGARLSMTMPPDWADKIVLPPEPTFKRANVLQVLLEDMLQSFTTQLLLASWVGGAKYFPPTAKLNETRPTVQSALQQALFIDFGAASRRDIDVRRIKKNLSIGDIRTVKGDIVWRVEFAGRDGWSRVERADGVSFEIEDKFMDQLNTSDKKNVLMGKLNVEDIVF